ncbi:Tigger transposable element-derived protein 1 [Phytophthora citrophthora]|uniref:Tigger transposable element-derived protein 1 n=1 Tax=Phytophthora citrophthora TaxID=4793 RepID=A0AAD9LDX5_9STRA|nr:Tigger transposable element-derived protein 1 [Phytophthora citrophthora]
MTKPTTTKEQCPRRRQSDTPAQKAEAVLACKRGKSVDEVSDSTKIPARCIRRWVKIDKDTSAYYSEAMTTPRHGPPPLLCLDAENNIYDWIIGRQMQGTPVGRQEIIQRAGKISLLVCGAVVGEGWYRRFKDRFPAIGARRSQPVTKARNTVSTEDITSFFWSLTKVMIENEIGLDASHIFNVDETAFKCGNISTQVVALRGSRNVWHTDPSMSFHLSFVACGSAGGNAVPPLFILPGERVDIYILEECSIPGAAVTTTGKAFMTARLFTRWLVFFSEAVPDNINRPIVLIMDGCSSHFPKDIKQTAKRLQFVLVCLPANATHLLQPLDVACFSSFKVKLKVLIDQLVGGKGEYSISNPW